MPEILNFSPRAFYLNASQVTLKYDSEAAHYFPRVFHFDMDARYNCASRVMVTMFGKTTELFELDGLRCDCAKISSKMNLQPDTDYIFRFAVTHGMSELENEVCRCGIIFDDDVEQRVEYDLAESHYQPIISKQTAEGELLRVFEIPFHTTESGVVQIEFRAQDCLLKIYAPLENAEYGGLTDCTVLQWKEHHLAAYKMPVKEVEERPVPNPVDALMDKLNRLTEPVSSSNASNIPPLRTAAQCSQDEADEKLANWVQEYMATRNVELNVADAMKEFGISERQATKVMRILFERNVLKYDLDTKKYKVIGKITI